MIYTRKIIFFYGQTLGPELQTPNTMKFGVPVKENKLRYSKYDEKQAGGKDKLKPLSEYTFKDSWYHDF